MKTEQLCQSRVDLIKMNDFPKETRIRDISSMSPPAGLPGDPAGNPAWRARAKVSSSDA